MSFGDQLKNLGVKAFDKAMELNDEYEMYMDKNSSLSDEALLRRYRSSCKKTEKMACLALLKERGYGDNN
ncbi:MAG: hypothetical protein Q4D26_06795 [Clostridia bacterium]|nr:hypothetical protein [Clostridia bacterium]